MITKEKYLETKIIFLNCIEILKEYKLQPKEKNIKKKKTFSIDSKIININDIFNKKEFYSYSKLINKIVIHFGIGISNSKKILTELQNEKLIIKSGIRGKYRKNY